MSRIKMYSRNEGKIKTFSDKRKPRDCVISRSALTKGLKGRHTRGQV
jgi:hypothetical protein